MNDISPAASFRTRGEFPLVLVVAAPDDRDRCERFLKHLRPLETTGLCRIFCNLTSIRPGEDRRVAVANALTAARLLVPLVSSSLLSDDELQRDVMGPANIKERVGQLRVLPAPLRHTSWKGQWFEHYEPAWPHAWTGSATDEDSAFEHATDAIRTLCLLDPHSGTIPPSRSPLNARTGEKTVSHAKPDILLLCALRDEYDQVLQVSEGLIAGWESQRIAGGWLVADATFRATTGEPLTIRASYAPHMGEEHISGLCSKLMAAGQPRCLAMSGICGGRRGDVQLGDVIFADMLWFYQAGKTTLDPDGTEQFLPDAYPTQPKPIWVQRMKEPFVSGDWVRLRPGLTIDQQTEWLILELHQGRDPQGHGERAKHCPDWERALARARECKWITASPPFLTAEGESEAKRLQYEQDGIVKPRPDFDTHVGPMATGGAVIKVPDLFPHLAGMLSRRVLGVEMEASALGVMGAYYDLPVVVAKGVTDFADPYKDDTHRHFAARAAAECLIAFLRRVTDLYLPGSASQPNGSGAEATRLSPPLTGQRRPAPLPTELIEFLADNYYEVSSARYLWQRAGGRPSDVPNITRPRELWHHLLKMSADGATAPPSALLTEVLEDYPGADIIRQHLTLLEQS